MTQLENDTLDFLNSIFEGNSEHVEEIAEEIENHQDGQDPKTTTVACSDSRVMQHKMWKNDVLGQEFTQGVIGNHVNTYTSEGEEAVAGSVDYIPEHSETETVVAVIGHTGCGAVTATYETLEMIDEDIGLSNAEDLSEADLAEYNGETTGINTDIKLLMESGLIGDYREVSGTGTDQEEISKLVERNVDNQIEFLLEQTDYDDTVFAGLVYDMDGSYGGEKGQLYLVNFGGATEVQNLEREVEAYDSIDVERLN
jgi:carbonic anhydrase